MAYVPLTLPDDLPTGVHRVIRGTTERFLEDIHWMLATAHPERGPKHQFQRPSAVALLAIVAGISRLPFKDDRQSGKRFKDCLNRFFPWDVDPPDGVSPIEAAEILYSVFRNPLVHQLGIDFDRSYAVKIGAILAGSENAEKSIEEMERSAAKPHTKPCLVVSDNKRVLWVNPFYWGVRRLIERWAADSALVRQTEERISSIIRPTGD